MNEELTKRLEVARAAAMINGVPVRRKDGTLYRLLADCMSICEMVEREGIEDDLREALRVRVDKRDPSVWGKGRAAGNAGRGKRYVEQGSPIAIMVCRYVLEGDERNNPYRYAICIREAMRRQIKAADLFDWLTENGGLNTLYKGRPLDARSLNIRTLNLNQTVEVPAVGEFTLRLERDHRGFFNVLKP